MKLRRSNRDVDEAVVSLLADEFEWDDTTRDICRRQLILGRSYTGGWPPGFEFICDNPISANWRLKPDQRAGPWALRMSFYGFSEDALARADDLTRKIAAA